MNIEVNKVYDYWDNGKSSPSRKYDVIITQIIPCQEIDEQTLDFWVQEVKDCPWLYAPQTDVFIKGNLSLHDNVSIEEVIFVRTLDGGYFSLGFWAGRLKEKINDERS